MVDSLRAEAETGVVAPSDEHHAVDPRDLVEAVGSGPSDKSGKERLSRRQRQQHWKGQPLQSLQDDADVE